LRKTLSSEQELGKIRIRMSKQKRFELKADSDLAAVMSPGSSFHHSFAAETEKARSTMVTSRVGRTKSASLEDDYMWATASRNVHHSAMKSGKPCWQRYVSVANSNF
jgi:hypothetical protein